MSLPKQPAAYCTEYLVDKWTDRTSAKSTRLASPLSDTCLKFCSFIAGYHDSTTCRIVVNENEMHIFCRVNTPNPASVPISSSVVAYCFYLPLKTHPTLSIQALPVGQAPYVQRKKERSGIRGVGRGYGSAIGTQTFRIHRDPNGHLAPPHTSTGTEIKRSVYFCWYTTKSLLNS